MVRTTDSRFLNDGSGLKYYDFSGLSSDEKPVGKPIATGSMFLEVDTGDVYAYDETSDGTWYKIASLGGGA